MSVKPTEQQRERAKRRKAGMRELQLRFNQVTQAEQLFDVFREWLMANAADLETGTILSETCAMLSSGAVSVIEQRIGCEFSLGMTAAFHATSDDDVALAVITQMVFINSGPDEENAGADVVVPFVIMLRYNDRDQISALESESIGMMPFSHPDLSAAQVVDLANEVLGNINIAMWSLKQPEQRNMTKFIATHGEVMEKLKPVLGEPIGTQINVVYNWITAHQQEDGLAEGMRQSLTDAATAYGTADDREAMTLSNNPKMVIRVGIGVDTQTQDEAYFVLALNAFDTNGVEKGLLFNLVWDGQHLTQLKNVEPNFAQGDTHVYGTAISEADTLANTLGNRLSERIDASEPTGQAMRQVIYDWLLTCTENTAIARHVCDSAMQTLAAHFARFGQELYGPQAPSIQRQVAVAYVATTYLPDGSPDMSVQSRRTAIALLIDCKAVLSGRLLFMLNESNQNVEQVAFNTDTPPEEKPPTLN